MSRCAFWVVWLETRRDPSLKGSPAFRSPSISRRARFQERHDLGQDRRRCPRSSESEVPMHRRILRFAAISVVFLSACASTAEREFASDRMSVITRGSGPDVILIPGLTGHREEWWGEVVETLDDRYRLHLVQVNGFAGTAPGANIEGPVSAPVAEEMARYIRERDLDRPAVIGHSMGGTVGMMLAARHPDAVGRLMVVDMVPALGPLFGPPNATPEQVRASADTFRARILADTAGAPNGMLEQMFPGMTRVDSMRPKLLEGVRGTDRRTAANAFHELILADLRPELSRITVPVTVLYVVPPDAPMPPDQYDRVMREAIAAL